RRLPPAHRRWRRSRPASCRAGSRRWGIASGLRAGPAWRFSTQPGGARNAPVAGSDAIAWRERAVVAEQFQRLGVAQPKLRACNNRDTILDLLRRLSDLGADQKAAEIIRQRGVGQPVH